MTCDNMLTHNGCEAEDSAVFQPLLPSKNLNLFAKKTSDYGKNTNRLLNGMLFDVSVNHYKSKSDVATTTAPPTTNAIDILNDALDVLGDDGIDYSSERIAVVVEKKDFRFAMHDMIHEIPHIDDLSDEEVEDVWIGRKEMKEIRRNAISIVRKIDNDEHDCDERIVEELKEEDGGDSLNIRGLDQNTESYMKKRQATQGFIYETVFRLQPFKKQDGEGQSSAAAVDVDGIIADLYSKYSASDFAAALERAKLDEWEAREVYCEEFYYSK